MSRLTTCCFILSFIQLSGVFAQEYCGKLGVEAAGDAFVDVVRQSYRWTDAEGKPLTTEEVDEQGWPQVDCRWIIDFRPVAEWAGSIDDPEAYRIDRSGTYLGSFQGAAELIVSGGTFSIANRKYDSRSNITTFELIIPKPGPQHGLVVLGFKNTRRTPAAAANSGIRDFRLLHPGYARDGTKLFTDAYLACLKSADFSTIRFMGVLDTNGNVEWGKDHTRNQTWNHRKLPGDAAVTRMDSINKKDGWPWEYVIELCNQAGMDPWINIPVSADDDYILQLAKLFRERLNPARAIYIEHSNEMWNWGFKQYSWNKARAAEEVKDGSVQYDYDHTDNPELLGQRRHAQRVKDSVAIFASVFGKEEINRRLRGVLSGHSADPNGYFMCGRLTGMLEYLRATGSDPKKWIYAISIPLYYGGPLASGKKGSESATVDEILESMRQSVIDQKAQRLAVVHLAEEYGLPGGFCSYEGGPGIGVGNQVNLANRIQAVRDQRQRDIYKLNFAEGFWDLGGNLAMQFTLAGPYTRYGTWGLTDDISNPDRNSLFQAVRELIGPCPKEKDHHR